MNITALHQIEITSECNLRCRYCTHPKMPRPKMHMTADVYDQALDHAAYYIRQMGTQRELNLAGIGESTLHPEFEAYVRKAYYEVVKGTECRLILATNGIEIAKRPELAEVLKECDVWTWVSLHRPEKAGRAVEILKNAGVLRGVSADPSIAAMNWAGQVEWHVSAQTKGQPCTWLSEGRVMVMSDGRVTTCCLDSDGSGVVGTIYEDLTEMDVKPYGLCASCHLEVPEPEEAIYADAY